MTESKKRILVIEDNKTVLAVTLKYLELTKYDAKGLESLAAVMEMAKTEAKFESYDAVITDWDLGDGTGADARDIIQQSEANIPFLLYSSSEDRESFGYDICAPGYEKGTNQARMEMLRVLDQIFSGSLAMAVREGLDSSNVVVLRPGAEAVVKEDIRKRFQFKW